MKKKIERNYWPHTIITMIILAVIAGAWTIKIALDNPVEMDSYYFAKYQKVDRNMNEILERQEAFDDSFIVEYGINKIKKDENFTIPIKIKNKKDGSYLQNAEITFLLTRPHTNSSNIELNATSTKTKSFDFGPLKVSELGRWQIMTKIKIGEKEGFFTYELNATI